MTRLTDAEKIEIVQTFQTLKEAVRAGAEPRDALQALQLTYRGDLRGYVDGFEQAHDKSIWIGQLEIYLHKEIEASRWW